MVADVFRRRRLATLYIQQEHETKHDEARQAAGQQPHVLLRPSLLPSFLPSPCQPECRIDAKQDK